MNQQWWRMLHYFTVDAGVTLKRPKYADREKRLGAHLGCDKMIDCSFEDGFVQLHCCCWESQQPCFCPFAPSSVRSSICLCLCFFIPCFSWFTTAKVLREQLPRKFPVETYLGVFMWIDRSLSMKCVALSVICIYLYVFKGQQSWVHCCLICMYTQ